MALSVDESPIWLAHHWPDHYDRCVRVGRQHVCRRCLVLYPTVVVVAIVATGLDLGASFGWAPWLLPLPLAVDWIGEHLGRLRYSPTRQIATTLLAAVGFGVALAVHLDRPFAATAVAPVLTTRERDVLLMLARGATYEDIGRSLYVTTNTVKTHVTNVYRKLGARTRSEALAAARSLFLL